MCVQECLYCKDAAEDHMEENLPEMDIGEMGEELSQECQNAKSQSEESQPMLDSGS